jgi:hypothetical protein
MMPCTGHGGPLSSIGFYAKALEILCSLRAQNRAHPHCSLPHFLKPPARNIGWDTKLVVKNLPRLAMLLAFDKAAASRILSVFCGALALESLSD